MPAAADVARAAQGLAKFKCTRNSIQGRLRLEKKGVVLQWPEKMSQESYDEFVDWIDRSSKDCAIERRKGKVQKKQT
jgi:hypothetical protein